MVKVGDLFEITLSDGRKAIGHFVYWDEKYGPFIQVFNIIKYKYELKIEDAITKGYMFPPIITGLKAAVRKGLWPVIGKRKITDFKYPNFLRAYWNEKTGEVKNWFLFDGVNTFSLGSVLPEEYKNLEYLVVWSPFDVIYRIETGTIPFPYGEMIRDNKFIPIAQNKKSNADS
jgi:hypothetical protein